MEKITKIERGIRKVTYPTGEISYEVIVKRIVNGKTGYRRCRKSKSLPEARSRRCELVEKLKNELLSSETPTFGDWILKWLDQSRRSLKNSTIESYTKSLSKHVPEEIWLRKINQVKQSDIKNIIFNTGLELTPKTRQNLLQTFKTIFRDAQADRLIPSNPCDGIRVRSVEPQLSAWTLSEVNYLLAHAAKNYHPWFCHFSLAVLTGMRSGELYALRWQNIDLENRRIYVVENWTNKDGYHETKSKRNRVVPMNSMCFSFLYQLKAIRGEQEFVLPHYNDWSKGYQAKVLRDFAKGIGLREVNFHALRASFITICLLQGVEPVKVQHIVGHTRLDTTMRYVRLVASDLDGALDKLGIQLPKLIAGQITPPQEIPKFIPKQNELIIPEVDLAKVLELRPKKIVA